MSQVIAQAPFSARELCYARNIAILGIDYLMLMANGTKNRFPHDFSYVSLCGPSALPAQLLKMLSWDVVLDPLSGVSLSTLSSPTHFNLSRGERLPKKLTVLTKKVLGRWAGTHNNDGKMFSLPPDKNLCAKEP